MDADQRPALLAAKLRGLVRARWGVAPEPSSFPGGAAGTTVVDGVIQGWVLADDRRPRGALGGALTWADRVGVAGLNVLIDDEAAGNARAGGALVVASSAVARRALSFTDPPHIWAVHGTELVEAHPALPPEPSEPPAEALVHLERIEAAGAVAVVEHGVVIAEVDGLEVARTVTDPDGSIHLEIGVGRHDRMASSLMAGPFAGGTDESLRRVVELVSAQRASRDVTQPLSNLAPERRLRRRIIDDPSPVGCRWLEPLPPVEPAPSIKEPFPAGALGKSASGGEVVVVCSSGVDLELVPLAADLRGVHAPSAELVLVVPPGDDHPVTRQLANRLCHPAEIVTLDLG
ncbi:MAG TPA: hypothetical protein VGA13_08990 [Acidimicrobiales bacterium]